MTANVNIVNVDPMTYLEPAHVEQVFEEGEDRKVDVGYIWIIIDKLTTHKASQEEGVNSYSYHLHRKTNTHTHTYILYKYIYIYILYVDIWSVNKSI